MPSQSSRALVVSPRRRPRNGTIGSRRIELRDVLAGMQPFQRGASPVIGVVLHPLLGQVSTKCTT